MSWIVAALAFVCWSVLIPFCFSLLRLLGVYDVVQECHCHVYTLFGKVVGVMREPGLVWLWPRMGPTALVVRWLGTRYVVDLRRDQTYIRSQPVNSEEGAPMGIGLWYEMFVSDPVAFLFENTDPRGSLRANVSNAAVRCLSNMPLAAMLQTRHSMSESVRNEVSPESHKWGYRLGSVYVRKVHFRDGGMLRQIEEKVVNRLRQVTSAIRQEGANQVSVITSAAEREAAVDFAKAAALRPQIVGGALQRISRHPDVAETLFDVLETQRLLEAKGKLTLVPARSAELLPQLLTSAGLEQRPVTERAIPAVAASRRSETEAPGARPGAPPHARE